MICPQCGVLLPENIAACGQCGFAFKPGDQPGGPATGQGHGPLFPPASGPATSGPVSAGPASSGETATVFAPSRSGPLGAPVGQVSGETAQATVFDLPLAPATPVSVSAAGPTTGPALQEQAPGAAPADSRPSRDPGPAGMVHGWLVALDGPDLGRDFRIGPQRPRMAIGRTPGPGVLDLGAEGVEEFHALLLFDGRELAVLDLDSAGGVRVNGSPARRAALADGDELALGRARLRFRAFRP